MEDVLSMKAVDQDREFDTTALRSAGYATRVHRDYLAHVFRWGWASRLINTGDTGAHRVLEAGCGADAPLYLSLRQSRGINHKPDLYVGVDLNKIPLIERRSTTAASFKSMVLKEEFNFVNRWPELLNEYGATFDMAVSFEVIEHMTESHGDEYLRGVHALLVDGGRLLISTPVFNGHAANNHIKEYTVAELKVKLERAGFTIKDRFGTFASYNDIKRGIDAVFSPEQAVIVKQINERAREFYSDEVMSCFLAPLLPDYSRNNAWIAVK